MNYYKAKNWTKRRWHNGSEIVFYVCNENPHPETFEESTEEELDKINRSIFSFGRLCIETDSNGKRELWGFC